MSAFSLLLRILGPALVMVALSLIGYVIHVVIRFALPLLARPGSLSWLFHIALALYLSFGILFHYVMVIRTPPGNPPPGYSPATEMESDLPQGEVVNNGATERSSLLQQRSTNNEDSDGSGDAEQERAEERRRRRERRRERRSGSYCYKCEAAKPPMTHHCAVCKKCVLRMDHHCPWIWNCVGFRNHKFFYLFLFYLWLGCLYAAAVCYTVSNWYMTPEAHSIRPSLTFATVLASSVLLAISVLLSFHSFLVVTAQTTIEYHWNTQRAAASRIRGETWRNPYDLGWRRNIEMFFGTSDWRMFWLPSTKPPSGDGLRYATRDQLEQEAWDAAHLKV